MTLPQDIDTLQVRIATAETARDAWRLAGREDKYLEAYFMVEALELQLDERRRHHNADPLKVEQR
jgi:hypothetical protein